MAEPRADQDRDLVADLGAKLILAAGLLAWAGTVDAACGTFEPRSRARRVPGSDSPQADTRTAVAHRLRRAELLLDILETLMDRLQFFQ